jgi:hypothetical protein
VAAKDAQQFQASLAVLIIAAEHSDRSGQQAQHGIRTEA